MTRAILLLFASLSLFACSGSDSAGGSGAGGNAGGDGAGGSGGDTRGPAVTCNDDDDLEVYFQPQAFADSFDCGRAGNRWLSPWEAVVAGSLDPAAAAPEVLGSEDAASVKGGAGSAPAANYVLQSPDPMLEEGFSGCTDFSAAFEEEGTLAFNYFVQTEPGIAGIPRTGNHFEVVALSFKPDDQGLSQQDERRVLFTTSGKESSRFFETLPAGDYIFQFCHIVNQTEDVELPDFVQIDDVETCVGTSCRGQIPDVARCRVDQGQTVVPSLSSVPIPTFELNRVKGSEDRYYLIIDMNFLDFIVGGLDTLEGERWDAVRAEVDGLRTQTLVDGRTCDIDTRRSLLFEMSDDEFLEFLLDTGIVEEVLAELEQAFIEGATTAAANAVIDKVEQKIGEAFATFVGKMVGRLIARLL